MEERLLVRLLEAGLKNRTKRITGLEYLKVDENWLLIC